MQIKIQLGGLTLAISLSVYIYKSNSRSSKGKSLLQNPKINIFTNANQNLVRGNNLYNYPVNIFANTNQDPVR